MKTSLLRKALAVSALLITTGLLAAPGFADPGDPPGRVARLSLVEGKVSFQPSGENQWGEATVNHPVTTGDRVFVDQGSRAELEVGAFAVRLAQGTDLTLANLNDQLMQLGIGQGTIRVTIYDLPPNNTVEIDTPNGALLLQRPGAYRVDTASDGRGTRVIVNTGLLQVTGGGADQIVESGHAVQLTGADQVRVAAAAMPPALDDFDKWSQARDARLQNSASARYVPRDEPGVEDLDPHGVWSEVPNVGPVWYPSAVPPGWVPYSAGHWVFIEPWGWTWVGAEPWGYAPYHYGRWTHIGMRWGWVPGPVVRPVYAPALVAFVGGPGFAVGVGGMGLTAWFPLGPREPYLPWYHYGPGYFRGVNVTVVSLTNLNSYHYMNRETAVTAVRGEDFRTGLAVQSRRVRVGPEQLAHARVIPHPNVTPAHEAVFGARTVAAPPIRAAGGFGRPGPVARAAIEASRTPMPAAGPGGANRYGGGPPNTPFPHMVTRNAPGAGNAPYSSRQSAYTAHPGRPLEPQQMSNLRAGKPAGPMQDKEVPGHAAKQSPPRSDSRGSSHEDGHSHGH